MQTSSSRLPLRGEILAIPARILLRADLRRRRKKVLVNLYEFSCKREEQNKMPMDRAYYMTMKIILRTGVRRKLAALTVCGAQHSREAGLMALAYLLNKDGIEPILAEFRAEWPPCSVG